MKLGSIIANTLKKLSATNNVDSFEIFDYRAIYIYSQNKVLFVSYVCLNRSADFYEIWLNYSQYFKENY